MEIKKIEEVNSKTLNIIRKRSKKKQILLFDTQRRFKHYVQTIINRNNGKYDKVPHFIINKTGEVFQLFNTNFSSNFFDNNDIDKTQIKIAIENLGWLNKNTISGFFTNWISETVVNNPFIKDWRGYSYWDRYTIEQMESLTELCKKLCNENEIPFQITETIDFKENIRKFKGIVCKSNFSDIYVNITPAFNFKYFNEYDKRI